jgi:hypothetical protein
MTSIRLPVFAVLARNEADNAPRQTGGVIAVRSTRAATILAEEIDHAQAFVHALSGISAHRIPGGEGGRSHCAACGKTA